MDKLYMVRAYYEDYDSSSWKIIGLFTSKRQADDIKKKWHDYYMDRSKIFDEPKDWQPDDIDDIWSDTDEYAKRTIKYQDVYNFKDIEVEEYPLNKEMIMDYPDISEDSLLMMTQWDRDYKLKKIIN